MRLPGIMKALTAIAAGEVVLNGEMQELEAEEGQLLAEGEQAVTSIAEKAGDFLSKAGETAKNLLYRVLRPGELENLDQGLTAKNPDADYSITTHVLKNSQSGYASQYISSTKSLEVAQSWAAKTGNEIVGIDSSMVGSTIDLSTSAAQNAAGLTHPMARAFAQASQEVLIPQYVPPDAIVYPLGR